MRSRLKKFKQFLNNPDKKKARTVIGIAAIALIVILCIIIIMQSHIQGKYASTAAQMQEQIYQNLQNMHLLFMHVDDENVDVQNKLIPALKEEYASASSLNEALRTGYGAKYAVLDEEITQAFETAFDEYAAAYKEGSATGLAQADMAACMEWVKEQVDARYAPAEQPEDEVIVIDGTSGEQVQ